MGRDEILFVILQYVEANINNSFDRLLSTSFELNKALVAHTNLPFARVVQCKFWGHF